MTSAEVRKAACAGDMMGGAKCINSTQRSIADLQAFRGAIWCI
jgi:hypothetical protein